MGGRGSGVCLLSVESWKLGLSRTVSMAGAGRGESVSLLLGFSQNSVRFPFSGSGPLPLGICCALPYLSFCTPPLGCLSSSRETSQAELDP